MRPFVHLHSHSEYSLIDGISRLPQMVSRAKELNMPALALTDHGNMYGAIYFYKEAMAQGIKPILGCEVYVTEVVIEEVYFLERKHETEEDGASPFEDPQSLFVE